MTQKDSQGTGQLLAKLTILDESAKYFGFTRFQLGNSDSLQKGLLSNLARQQLLRQALEQAQTDYTRYRHAYDTAHNAIQACFPEYEDQLSGRVKEPASIADKLLRKSLRKGPAIKPIQDGIGFRLTLENPTRQVLSEIRQLIVAALEQERIQLLEINNFYPDFPEALAYLSDTDIEKIRHAAETVSPTSVKISTGPDQFKPTGYITTQMNLKLRNPETQCFDLPPCELQIRGKAVDTFSSVEHLIYALREEKTVWATDGKHPWVMREIEPLLEAIQIMNEAQFDAFTGYLSQFYSYYRQLEDGQSPPEPKLPGELPMICHISSLQRLSNLRRAALRNVLGH